jgi:hypothetical protein
MKIKRTAAIVSLIAWSISTSQSKDYHVGADHPLKTISAAEELAQPWDTIIVHEGIYREEINPPRGGTSDAERILYTAAPGAKVVIKGSEPIKCWTRVQNDTWKVTLANSFFGDFNPYSDLIRGDWFGAKGRTHHTGAVYIDGHWLKVAASKDLVLKPAVTTLKSKAQPGANLLNIAWLQPGGGIPRVRSWRPPQPTAREPRIYEVPNTDGVLATSKTEIGWSSRGSIAEAKATNSPSMSPRRGPPNWKSVETTSTAQWRTKPMPLGCAIRGTPTGRGATRS